MNTNETVKVDKVSELLPKVNESRPCWIARVVGSVLAWFRGPRSRIGLAAALAAGCLLMQGCATNGPSVLGAAAGAFAGGAACHNYFVAEAEAEERAMLEAGKIPIPQSNWDLIRENWWAYGLSTVGGGAAGWGIAEWARDRGDNGDTTTVNETTNNYLPPEPVEPVAEGGE